MPDERRIEYVPLDDVPFAEKNPKRHDLDGLRASIARFGFTIPALLDERTGRLVAGHGRVEALRTMHDAGQSVPAGIRFQHGQWLAPVVMGWASRDDDEANAYLIADNRHTELAGWDDPMLAELLKDLALNDKLDGIGYTDDDVADLIYALDSAEGIVGGMSVRERASSYEGSAIRTVVLPYQEAVFRQVANWLEIVRTEYNVPSHSEVVLYLLAEHLGEELPTADVPNND